MRRLLKHVEELAVRRRELAVRGIEREVALLIPDGQLEASDDLVTVTARRAGRRFLEEPALRFLRGDQR